MNHEVDVFDKIVAQRALVMRSRNRLYSPSIRKQCYLDALKLQGEIQKLVRRIPEHPLAFELGRAKVTELLRKGNNA